MEKIFIDLDKNSYYIYIEDGILNHIDNYIGNADKIMIITDSNVEKLYGDRLVKGLAGRESYKTIINPGESSKTLETVESILSDMLDLNFTRKSKIIALGGGVVGDIAGFCASIYMRGIEFIQVPTTLLAQVDSSVGGKTGVNLPKGKNMIGSFYQPQVVLIDVDTLKSLNNREIVSGLGEVIKYGLIWDREFLNEIKNSLKDILSLKEKTLKNIIKKSCKIKAEIVSKDEREIGIRKILNYGHTIGHALETITDYKLYSHGQAILIGMYYEASMAKNLNMIDSSYFKEIENIIQSLEISLDISRYSREELIDNMMGDKKNRDGKISFILPSGPGEVEERLLERGEVSWQIMKQ